MSSKVNGDQPGQQEIQVQDGTPQLLWQGTLIDKGAAYAAACGIGNASYTACMAG